MQRALPVVTLCLILFLLGCGPTGGHPPTQSASTLSRVLQATLTPTRTPTPKPTATRTPTPTPPPLLGTLEIDPPELLPGRTLLVRLTSSLPASASASLEQVPLMLFSDESGTRYTALVGLSVWTSSGPQILRATLQDARGRVSTVTATVEVLPTDYPVEYIELLPGREELLDPEIIEEEWARLRPILETVTPERLWEGVFISPTHGYITSYFGAMRSYDGGPPSSYHNGVDISNITGTVVLAAARGRVVLAEPLKVRGGAVILDHGWGVHSGYLHFSEILVQEGDIVEQGQPIGKIGASGLVTGAHLHWEIRLGLTPVDPLEWLWRAFP